MNFKCHIKGYTVHRVFPRIEWCSSKDQRDFCCILYATSKEIKLCHTSLSKLNVSYGGWHCHDLAPLDIESPIIFLVVAPHLNISYFVSPVYTRFLNENLIILMHACTCMHKHLVACVKFKASLSPSLLFLPPSFLSDNARAVRTQSPYGWQRGRYELHF